MRRSVLVSSLFRDGYVHSQQESHARRAEASLASVLQALASKTRGATTLKRVRLGLTRENKTVCTALIQVLKRCLRFAAQTRSAVISSTETGPLRGPRTRRRRAKTMEVSHWQNTEQREDKYGDHGGDHQQYLQQKRRKLDDQRMQSGENNWFAGCIVWIDGLTDPPADELERLVVEGGGSTAKAKRATFSNAHTNSFMSVSGHRMRFRKVQVQTAQSRTADQPHGDANIATKHRGLPCCQRSRRRTLFYHTWVSSPVCVGGSDRYWATKGGTS